MSKKIRLLVRADDAGSSWSSNIGCLNASTRGVVKSVEVMMPCAWTSHAAMVLGHRTDIDIGIHLTLTSEWDAMKWRPITAANSLTDEFGNFFALLHPKDGDQRPSLSETDWLLDEIAHELRAQVVLGLKMFPHASHVSTHMLKHFRDFDARLGGVVSDICEEFGISDDAFGYDLTRIDGYPKFPRNAERRVESLVHQLGELQPGTYIFIDHPAVASAELAAMGHIGYEDVAEDRLACMDALTSPDLREQIHHIGIELISYRDL